MEGPLGQVKMLTAIKFIGSKIKAQIPVIQATVSGPLKGAKKPTPLKFICKLGAVVGAVGGDQVDPNKHKPETEPETRPEEQQAVRPQTVKTAEDSPLLYPNCDLSVWLRSCDEEVVTPLDGTTTGTIPAWINGKLFRNGPGKLHYQKQTVKHLFDAAGLLHG